MRRDQWNFVFLACALCVAAFSVFLAFQMTGQTGNWMTYSWDGVTTAPGSTARTSMAVLGRASATLEDEFRKDPRGANRRYVLTAAASISAHAEALTLNPPEGLSKTLSGKWDSFLEQMRVSADAIADVAATPDADMRAVSRSYLTLKKTCVDCHATFGVVVPEA